MGEKIISSVWLNGNITKEAFHFEEVLFYDRLILLKWYNNKHDKCRKRNLRERAKSVRNKIKTRFYRTFSGHKPTKSRQKPENH